MLRNYIALITAIAAVLCPPSARAFVTPEESSQLKTTLTPLGAERAGNADGSIPAWTGAYKTTLPGFQPGSGKYPDPFPGEKPLYSIKADNFAKYESRLSEGTIALLKKFPTYRIDVYPTHRTGGAPDWVYESTFKNATTAKVVQGGKGIEGAWGGVPFPIPRSGVEVIWNHTFKPRVPGTEERWSNLVGNANGSHTLVARGQAWVLSPYHNKDMTQQKADSIYGMSRARTAEPPYKAGEEILVHDRIDPDNSRQAWQYLVGQRRTRRAPTIGYDTPDFVASGADYFDEVVGFWGTPERYDWKIVGKREMLVPYNNNRFFVDGSEAAMVPYHTNPDKLRWELHRVWVVEATLAAGKRHVVPKRRFYVDEDSWSIMIVDGYDAEGKLWRTNQVLNIVMPDQQMLLAETTLVYNLQATTYSLMKFEDQVKITAPKSLGFFAPEALGADSLR